jgi:hypothetical protein
MSSSTFAAGSGTSGAVAVTINYFDAVMGHLLVNILDDVVKYDYPDHRIMLSR